MQPFLLELMRLGIFAQTLCVKGKTDLMRFFYVCDSGIVFEKERYILAC